MVLAFSPLATANSSCDQAFCFRSLTIKSAFIFIIELNNISQ